MIESNAWMLSLMRFQFETNLLSGICCHYFVEGTSNDKSDCGMLLQAMIPSHPCIYIQMKYQKIFWSILHIHRKVINRIDFVHSKRISMHNICNFFQFMLALIHHFIILSQWKYIIKPTTRDKNNKNLLKSIRIYSQNTLESFVWHATYFVNIFIRVSSMVEWLHPIFCGMQLLNSVLTPFPDLLNKEWLHPITLFDVVKYPSPIKESKYHEMFIRFCCP